jgi:glucose/arabinose dehydrogenase/mono/diheme cytochrome c family protein/streptogramin lyase
MSYRKHTQHSFGKVALGAGACLVLALVSPSMPLSGASSSQAIDLPGRAFPESITSTSDGTVFAGNFAEGGILRIKNGKPEAWIKPGTFGTRAILGVFADERSGTLWACSNDYAKMGLTSVGDPGSVLKGFDLKTGAGKVSLPLPSGPAECNDIAVAKDGSVFVSDTGAPRVLRLAPGAKMLEVWATDPRFKRKGGDTDGISIGDDGQLYVNTFGESRLFRIAIEGGKAGRITELQTSQPVASTDGMRHEKGNQFLMVEGVGKLDRVVMEGDKAIITTLREGLEEPTAVTMAGGTAWVSEGRLSYLFDAAKKGQQPPPFHLQGVALDAGASAKAAARGCHGEDVGITVPPGFCATVLADGIGHARHLAVSTSGVVYVNTWSGEYYNRDKPHEGGFLVALQEKGGSGKADVIERFGETVQSGGAGGTGIGIYKGSIYAEINDRVVRYSPVSSGIVPKGQPETVVSKLPLGGDHPMHPFAIGADGSLYVDVGTATNACQPKNRQPKIPGAEPCKELETRGGVWRYDANKTNQTFSTSDRFATGIRNAVGLAIDSGGRVFATQHGRDQLHSNWPDLYKPEEEATEPAEELLYVKSGGDYGWPECYYDVVQKKLVLAPEYGGDGGKKVGVCAQKTGAVAVFPAHWGPNALAIYEGTQFPVRYREGAFIAFHGSWNRAPYSQAGYNVVFQALKGDHASGGCEVFADGFAGAVKTPDGATHRPSGLAVGPDGSLYVSDDIRGRIYKIVYQGGGSGEPKGVPCPSISAPAGEVATTRARPPEGTNVDAGAAANAPVPPGATREMVALGNRVYQGQVGGASCVGCHGASGTGTPQGPDLTGKRYLWSDGSLAGITKVITEGVPQPKQYRSVMPPMGGAQLTSEQASALAAYVWGLSHR